MNRERRSGRWLLGFAAVALIAGVVWWQIGPRGGREGTVEAAPRAVAPRGDLAADEASIIELFERAKGSVVYIATTERVLDLWSRNVFNIPRGTGSGFVWDDQGHIVTNNHVVMGAAGARVRLNDGRDYGATLVGASLAHDLAVLRIRVPDHRPPPLPIGASSELKVGQKAFAIGNPFGLDWSLTTGIVSAINRTLPGEDGGTLLENLIQTDAAINPGNSGGPLLDSAGRLIGINTAIFSPSGAYAGVGFAVPVDTVNRVVPQLIARGKYVRPVLGIEADDQVSQWFTRRAGVKGVVVLRVTPGSPAAEAGLRGAKLGADGAIVPGDIITAVDGKPVEGVARLINRLDEKKVGDTVKLTVRRDGNDIAINVTLKAGA
jgi:S1-C subfamily serine protease